MSDKINDINFDIHDFPLRDLDSVYELIEMYYSYLPVKKEDLVVSVVFADLTRDPVVLLSRFRSKNFKGLHFNHYDQLQENYQLIKEESLLYKLLKEENLIVIEEVDVLFEETLGEEAERKFLKENDWKSIIMHSLFHDDINYGLIALFTQDFKLSEMEIELITEFLSQTMPTMNQKLFTAAFRWKSQAYKKDITELENHLSDLVIAITGKGIIMRVNSHSIYYFGKSPNELLGKSLKEINPKFYEGIQKSVKIDRKKQPAIEVAFETQFGQKLILELNAWKTNLSADDTIICFASDITLLKIYEEEITKKSKIEHSR